MMKKIIAIIVSLTMLIPFLGSQKAFAKESDPAETVEITSTATSKNYLIYPTKTMRITQNYDGTYSHTLNSKGKPADYPIDEDCGDAKRSYIYAPCDEVIVKRIYGVGNNGTNTIWLQSTKPVVTPTFTDYVTILVTHPNDDTLKKLKVGQKFTRKQEMFLEGDDGWATANHFHISVSRGKYTGNGWVKNNKGAWVITGTPVKPETAFYVDKNFTTIKNSNGLTFQTLPGGTSSANNNVSIVLDTSRNTIKANSARLYTKVTKPKSAKLTNGGIYLWKNGQSKPKTPVYKETFNGYTTQTSVPVNYTTDSEIGMSLSANTRYNYQIYVVIDGKTYNSNIGTFTTLDNSDKNVSITLDTSRNTIKAKTARLYTKVTKPKSAKLTNGGIYLWRKGQVHPVKPAYMETFNGYTTQTSVPVNYTTNTELGISLSPNTTYYYQIYVVIDGKTYSTKVGSFTTLKK